MPSFERESNRIVIAGASSLLGAELKSLLEESKFAGWDFRLLDEEIAAGTLTEAGGEPAVIQPVEEGSFDRARLIFFTGSAEFTRANLAGARQGKAQIVDLSGASLDETGTEPWFERLEGLRGSALELDAGLYQIPSAPATAAAMLSYALKPLGLNWLSLVVFHSVSEAGRAGIEELEAQTAQLLSSRSVGQPVFDVQVAFNMAAQYGTQSRFDLRKIRRRIFDEAHLALPPDAVIPTVQVLHAPVFYGATFSATAELQEGLESKQVAEACARAGFAVQPEEDPGPSNVTAAGEKVIQLAYPEGDMQTAKRWFFWGAADNIRLPAWNAVKLAEKLVR
jgi:aspartate-semialdehyde dehydrogenase